MSLYHDLILDHYKNPRNVGELPDADISVKEENIGCGDEIEIFMKHQAPSLRPELRSRGNKHQKDITMKWRGRGCAIATAAASLLSERVNQIRQISRIRQIGDDEIVTLLGGDISPSRMKCATLALRALQRAVQNIHDHV